MRSLTQCVREWMNEYFIEDDSDWWKYPHGAGYGPIRPPKKSLPPICGPHYQVPDCLQLEKEDGLVLLKQENKTLTFWKAIFGRTLHPLQNCVYALASISTYGIDTPPDEWYGTAIYIGDGLLLTATQWCSHPQAEGLKPGSFSMHVKQGPWGKIDFSKLAKGIGNGVMTVVPIAHLDPRIQCHEGEPIDTDYVISRSLAITLMSISPEVANLPRNKKAARPGIAQLDPEMNTAKMSFIGYNGHMKINRWLLNLYEKSPQKIEDAVSALKPNKVSVISGTGGFAEPFARGSEVALCHNRSQTAAFCSYPLSMTPTAAGGAIAVGRKLVGIHVGSYTAPDSEDDQACPMLEQPRVKLYPATTNIAINLASTRFRNFATAEIIPRLKDKKLKDAWLSFLNDAAVKHNEIRAGTGPDIIPTHAAEDEMPSFLNDTTPELKSKKFGEVCLDMKTPTPSLVHVHMVLE